MDVDCSHEIKRRLLLGKKAMTNLDSILKSRDITLPTKVCRVKAMIFLVGMYRYRRRQWHPTPVLLPRKPHGWRSLVGCSPLDRWGSDMTERLHFHFSLSCIGERNGSPLQCSCLENPRDGGAWWATIYGVAKSRTQLKWLSSRDLLGCLHCPLSWGSTPSIFFFESVFLFPPWPASHFPARPTSWVCWWG